MVSLQDLKKQSKQNLEKLVSKTKENTFNKQKDDRMWYPQRGEDGNGFAVIRFLPIPMVDAENENALAWAKIYSHSFKNESTGKWYIENSLSTFNEKDPCAEANQELWNKGEEGQAQARAQKRNLSYYSNVYVVKDPLHPENEGKVFIYRYGKKIYDKILELLSPDETYGEEPVDPFNFWTGRDFKIKIKTIKSGNTSFPNYDSSEWAPVAPISDKTGRALNDDEIEAVWASEYSLLELLDRKNFKTYDELKKKLDEVLGRASSDSDRVVEEMRKSAEKPKEQPKKSSVVEDDDVPFDVDNKSSDVDDTDELINQWINDDDD